jgi:uncharacterized protein (UPF0335 family)
LIAGHNLGISGESLKSFVERIERLEEEKRAIANDIKEVYAEAKGAGFDVKVMRQLIRDRKQNANDLDDFETVLATYKRALGMLADTPLGRASEPQAAQ